MFLESQRESWIEYTSELNQGTSVGKIYNKISRIKGKKKSNHIVNLISSNGNNLTFCEDIANELAHTFASNSHEDNYHNSFKIYKQNYPATQPNIHELSDSPLNNDISIEEIESTLKYCKNASPGPDKISNIILKNLPTICNRIYLQIV